MKLAKNGKLWAVANSSSRGIVRSNGTRRLATGIGLAVKKRTNSSHSIWKNAGRLIGGPRWLGQQAGVLSNAALSLVFPPTCVWCDSLLDVASIEPKLCHHCDQKFTLTESTCPKCGALTDQRVQPRPLASDSATGELPDQRASKTGAPACNECRGKKYAFDRVFALGRYAGEIQAAVVRMKAESGQSLAFALGKRLGDHLKRSNWRETPSADIRQQSAVLLTCISKHWLKRVLTGVNSAETIMKGVAKELCLPATNDLLICGRRVKKQSLLGPDQRIRNVKSAWSVNPDFDIHGIHVIIVDDTMTTGATANEAARVLKRAGCSRVSVAVIGRAANSV